MFTKDLALKLRVKPTRSKILENYTCTDNWFSEFGQHEDLTTRIQGIIRDYDFDITLLKELLQNADDAKANQVCFILDKREHKNTSVLSENWKELQGPALLVWNEQVFSEKDFIGIQKLGLGSKRYDEETIGKYGIGFNVVYHLTDCPSFISGGKTLCIFDPHRRYVAQAIESRPGAKLTITREFWDKFSDLKSAYLQTADDKIYNKFQNGTLFRFPLRRTEAMARKSEIFDPDISECNGQIETESLSTLMNQWMPVIKECIIFLNHVNEVSYIEISTNKLDIKFHYKTLTDRSTKSLQEFEKSVSSFPAQRKPTVIQYQICISDLADKTSYNGELKDKKESKEMKWLVQQGIGDLDKCKQEWQFSKTMKPRHAIAFPIEREPHNDNWRGNLFCFLPLPSQSSEMPAHINGSFFLDSHRRGLWKSSNPDTEDDRSRWNRDLLEAIASSYAELLIKARNKYLGPSYKSWHLARQDLHNYYALFPHFHSTDTETKLTSLQVYTKHIQKNAQVLCVLISSKQKSNGVLVEWHSLISEDESEQVYFGSHKSDERKIIHPILETIGMKISPAPARIMKSFNRIIIKEDTIKAQKSEDIESKDPRIIPALLPSTAFKYYTELSKFSKSQGMKTCQIESTEFKSVSTFLLFLKYVLGLSVDDHTTKNGEGQECSNERGVDISPSSTIQGTFPIIDEAEKIRLLKFPGTPFSHFLLVTADGILRTFDGENKVLNSTFHEMFPKRKSSFLHPDLQRIPFDPSYFITPYKKLDDEKTKQENDFIPISHVLESILPHDLCETDSISEAFKMVSKDTIVNVWKCLQIDDIFSSYCSKILKHYCLLLTRDSRLFSTSSNVLPCIVEQQPAEVSGINRRHIVAIMKALQMPFLNTDIVPIIETLKLPSLLDHDKVLNNFYHVNQCVSLTEVLKFNSSHYETLISYFSEAAKPGDTTWLLQISSLPIFTNIVGEYLSISKKCAYVCPEHICTSGYKKWADEDNVFIQENAKWAKLGSPEQLNMKRISPEELYCKFIFPKFSRLSESERYEHLSFIKNFVFHGCKTRCSEGALDSKEQSTSVKNAENFIESLNDLQCIETHSGQLLSISAFSDFTVELFQVFSNDFNLLPEKFREADWKEFFKELNLQQRPTTGKFVQLCKKVSCGEVEDIKKCSSTLLKYLFHKDNIEQWLKDRSFLREVSNIAFVPALNTSRVNWIFKSKSSEDDLVCLNGSATEELMSVLWTVQPIVCIPLDQHYQIHNPHVSTILRSMKFTSAPNPENVARNIQNICDDSPYSSERLLWNYPVHLMPDHHQYNLLEVIIRNFKYLQESYVISTLKGIACIPIFCVPSEKNKRKIALVHPATVISTSNTLTVESCYPYLHCLPQELLREMSILVELGVKSNLEVHHMQIVLAKVYANSKGEPLDPNSMNYVKMALNFLFNSVNVDDSIADQLSPLYLPDTGNQLRLSTNMLYSDTLTYHRKIDLHLEGTCFYHFDRTENNYSFSASDLCRNLPEIVRPKAMSVMCKQIPDENSESVSLNERTQSIETSLHHESNSLAIVQAFKIILNRNADAKLETIIQHFFKSLKIDAKRNMKTKIVLRDSGKVIGSTCSKFYFELHETPRMIFIDEQCDEFDRDDLYIEIADALCQLLLKNYQLKHSQHTKQLTSFIERYLKIEPHEKEMFLQRYNISLLAPIEQQFQFKLGQVIPEDYHHRLEQDVSNLFWPMEYVAYESETQHFIVAQIIRLVRSDEDDEDSASLMTRKYLIRTCDVDDNGILISIISLYKITATKHIEGEGMCGITALNDVTIESDISDIKLKIQEELQEIRKLDPELQKKAFRRLYLIWHPDKNLDNLNKAKEVFLFLKKEIEHLDTDGNNDKTYSEDQLDTDLPHGSEDSVFKQWDDIASKHRDASRKVTRRTYVSPPCMVHPDPAEGRRWIQQAEIDFGVLCVIHDSTDSNDCKFHGHVCFMAHQVAEKALKGGVYILCGLNDGELHQHDISGLAHNLETVKPDQTNGLSSCTKSLSSYYLNTRYPNRWGVGSDIPADHYEAEQADRAKQHAQNILAIVKTITKY